MKKKSTTMSPELVAKIKNDLAHGKLLHSQIAAKYNVNQGRVSEVKHGKYDHKLGTNILPLLDPND
jgi:predicted XRE-type DNA-binding protein